MTKRSVKHRAYISPTPITDSLAASFTVSARHEHDGRRSLPPTEQAPVPRSEQETWRERPRCARCKWPRSCPEGSLTPWLPVSMSVVCASVLAPGIAANQVQIRARNGVQIFRTIRARSCGKSWLQSRTRSVHDQANDPVSAANTIAARLWPRIRTMRWASSEAPTITPSMLDLCSASCKARRVAPPARTRGLRALTMPARRSILATT